MLLLVHVLFGCNSDKARCDRVFNALCDLQATDCALHGGDLAQCDTSLRSSYVCDEDVDEAAYESCITAAEQASCDTVLPIACSDVLCPGTFCATTPTTPYGTPIALPTGDTN